MKQTVPCQAPRHRPPVTLCSEKPLLSSAEEPEPRASVINTSEQLRVSRLEKEIAHAQKTGVKTKTSSRGNLEDRKEYNKNSHH